MLSTGVAAVNLARQTPATVRVNSHLPLAAQLIAYISQTLPSKKPRKIKVEPTYNKASSVRRQAL